MSGAKPYYTLDPNAEDRDRDMDEVVAVAGSFGYAAPTDRRADHITAGGLTLQYANTEFSELAPRLQSPVEPFKQSIGNRGHTYHQFVVRTAGRDQLREHLRALGIGTEIYYPIPLHLQKCFAQMSAKPCPVSESAAKEVLALPIFPELTDGEVEVVAKGVVSFFKK